MQGHKLDNPVWHALSETHKEFSIDFDRLKFYEPEYCPFGGFTTTDDISREIFQYAELTDNFFVVGNRPLISKPLKFAGELVCLQMTVDKTIDWQITKEIVLLGPEHREECFRLVTLVQPGYFRLKTILLGNYYGIFENGHLVSVAGERMKMNGFVELSAIVTHPAHTGKGYAKQLITHLTSRIFEEDDQPFLHVAETNLNAISLYKKLGFIVRRKISFWNFANY